MKWLLLALVIVAVIAYVKGQRARTERRARAAAELATVRRTVDEDVTVLGEELQRLDAELLPGDGDEAIRADHQRALDAYEAAKLATEAMRRPEDAQHVTEILDDGRYDIACVRARVGGQPLPSRRLPCFFDPRHGPSVTDVTWAPPHGALREVPACALDAERVRAGADPHTRQVLVGAQRVPYWQAGPAFRPMTVGYFGAIGVAQSLFVGTAMGAMLGGGLDGFGDVGGYSGDAGGESGGGFDGGGFDGGF